MVNSFPFHTVTFQKFKQLKYTSIDSMTPHLDDSWQNEIMYWLTMLLQVHFKGHAALSKIH